MAKPVCTFCEQWEGVLMDTNLETGDTQVICGSDLLMYALSMTAALTAGMTTADADTYADLLDQIRANDPRPPKPPAKGGRKPKPATEPGDLAYDHVVDDNLTRLDMPKPCTQCGGTTATGDKEKLTCDGCGAVIATADEAEG